MNNVCTDLNMECTDLNMVCTDLNMVCSGLQSMKEVWDFVKLRSVVNGLDLT